MLWEYASEKKIARQFALPSRSITNGIWLPADKAICVRAAYDNGLMKDTQHAFLVENVPAVYAKMLEATSDIPGRVPFAGDLIHLRLNCQVDYAFLDYMGGINRSNGKWMAVELSPKLVEGATVCITQMLSSRQNKILSQQDDLLRTRVGTFIRDNYGTLKLPYQRLLLLVHRVFRGWDFEVVPDEDGRIYQYADSVSTMLLLKLVNFRGSPANLSLFPELE